MYVKAVDARGIPYPMRILEYNEKMLFSALDHKQNYLTGKEMLEQREQEGKNWNDSSYARGRNHYNGQYMSRDIGDRMSGHYPARMIAYYPQDEYRDY